MEAPIPFDAPVTTATFPASFWAIEAISCAALLCRALQDEAGWAKGSYFLLLGTK
jgi:hypothetical protein